MTVYKVTGPSFQGHQHGDEFQAELEPNLERRAKARGQIRVVKRDDTKPSTTKEGKDDA